jgi:S-adenosylmethionine hydrolase
VVPDPAIFFLSDYGNADEFVGVVHAVLHRMAPSIPAIDLSHQVDPFDVSGGAAMLARAVPFLGHGVVLAVVDPGVGSGRRPIAVRTGGDGPYWLVGPDNGLLIEAAHVLGGPATAFVLDRQRLTPQWSPSGSGPTFDGRDIFAPAVAHLVTGGEPAAIGTEIPTETLVRLDADSPSSRPVPGPEAGTAMAPVTWIDRYGNVQLDLLPSVLDEMGVGANDRVRVTLGSGPDHVLFRRVRAFSDLEAGEFGIVVDANGRVALVLDQASAASRLVGTDVGVTVSLVPVDESTHER